MVTGARPQRIHGAGFTLLEMLLVVALLAALLGAVVFNFDSARRGADLDEGGRQFEALVRFASAHAANSGRSVQFRFGDEPSTNVVDDMGLALTVVWEPDPVLQPGDFVELAEARSFVDSISARVRIEKVAMSERPLNQNTNDLAVVQQGAFAAPTITFFPDGSSETASITFASIDSADLRRLTIRIDGVTGGVRSEMKVMDELVPVEWMEDENSAERPAVTQSAPEPSPMPEMPEPETTRTNDFNADFEE